MKYQVLGRMACLALLAGMLSVGVAFGQDCEPIAAEERCEDVEDVICHFDDLCSWTPSGSVDICAGSVGSGLCLNGDGYLVVGDDPRFSMALLEIEFHVRFDQLPGPGDHAAGLVTKYRGQNSAESEWGVFVEGNTTPYPVWYICGDGSLCIWSNAEVLTDVLYCVRVSFFGDWVQVSVNTEIVAAGPVARNSFDTDTPVIIGNSFQPGHNNPFHGMIDELRIGEVCSVAVETSTWSSVKAMYR